MVSDKMLNKRFLGENIAYSLSFFGYSLLAMTISTFSVKFFTDVLILPMTMLSATIFIIRLIDGAIDPFIGLYLDKRSSNIGRYKGYVAYAALPFCIFFVFIFLPSPFENKTASAIWTSVIYLFWSLAHSIIECAHMPMLATISKDKTHRRLSNSIKLTFGVLASLITRYFTLTLVDYFGKRSVLQGYSVTAIIFASISALFLCSIIFVKERHKPDPNRYSLKESFILLRKSKGVIFILAMYSFNQLASSLRSQSLLYYMQYNIKRQDLIATILALSVIFSLISQPLIYFCAKRFELNRLFAFTTLGTCLNLLLFPLAGSSAVLITINIALHGVLSAFPANLIFLQTANIADTVSLKSNSSFLSTIHSLLGTASKIGFAISGGIIPMVLTITGYVPNAVQNRPALAGITFCFIGIPTISYVLSAVFAYKTKKHQEQQT